MLLFPSSSSLYNQSINKKVTQLSTNKAMALGAAFEILTQTFLLFHYGFPFPQAVNFYTKLKLTTAGLYFSIFKMCSTEMRPQTLHDKKGPGGGWVEAGKGGGNGDICVSVNNKNKGESRVLWSGIF